MKRGASRAENVTVARVSRVVGEPVWYSSRIIDSNRKGWAIVGSLGASGCDWSVYRIDEVFLKLATALFLGGSRVHWVARRGHAVVLVRRALLAA